MAFLPSWLHQRVRHDGDRSKIHRGIRWSHVRGDFEALPTFVSLDKIRGDQEGVRLVRSRHPLHDQALGSEADTSPLRVEEHAESIAFDARYTTRSGSAWRGSSPSTAIRQAYSRKDPLERAACLRRIDPVQFALEINRRQRERLGRLHSSLSVAGGNHFRF